MLSESGQRDTSAKLEKASGVMYPVPLGSSFAKNCFISASNAGVGEPFV